MWHNSKIFQKKTKTVQKSNSLKYTGQWAIGLCRLTYVARPALQLLTSSIASGLKGGQKLAGQHNGLDGAPQSPWPAEATLLCFGQLNGSYLCWEQLELL